MKKVVSSMVLILALTLSIGMTAPTVSADPQTCEVLCITSNCTQNSDCTAEPNGHCDFVCPQNGCCVYH